MCMIRCIILLLFVLHASLSYVFHSFPIFHTVVFHYLVCFSVCLAVSVSCLYICMSFASGCSQSQYRPVVWCRSRSTSMHYPAERQPASHQLQRWSDCSFSVYRVWRMTHYLHTLNFIAAVISFVRLDKHQLWTMNVLSGNQRHLAIKKSHQIFLCNKSEQRTLLCLLLKILRAVLDPSQWYLNWVKTYFFYFFIITLILFVNLDFVVKVLLKAAQTNRELLPNSNSRTQMWAFSLF